MIQAMGLESRPLLTRATLRPPLMCNGRLGSILGTIPCTGINAATAQQRAHRCIDCQPPQTGDAAITRVVGPKETSSSPSLRSAPRVPQQWSSFICQRRQFHLRCIPSANTNEARLADATPQLANIEIKYTACIHLRHRTLRCR